MVEVLIVIMIVAIAFVLFLGAMAQAVKVSSKSAQLTDAISRYGALLFEIESGLRPDLTGYSGRGTLEADYHYQVDTEKDEEFDALLKSRLSWKEGKEFLELETLIPKAPIQ